MPIRSSPPWHLLAALVLAALPCTPAEADYLSSLLPGQVPGYDTQDGVSVRSRLHPELEPLGIRLGSVQFWPALDESAGYTSNALPGPYRRPSWTFITAPSLRIAADGADDTFGAALSLQDTRYPALPAQGRTDGSVAMGDRLAIGADQLGLAIAHLSEHEDRSQLGTLATDQPVGFSADDASATYTVIRDRWRIEPGLRLTDWRYDNTTILGVPTSQAYRDHLTLQGDLTLHYEWAPLRNLVLVARALGQDYTHAAVNQPGLDSTGGQFLLGAEDAAGSVWRWRLLVGADAIRYASARFAPQANLITEAGASWLPSGLTTVQATFARESTAAAQAGVSGLMLTTGRLAIDHEYLRNLLLQASFGLQRADYFQGGHQEGSIIGLGVTWILNRSARLSVTYDQTDLHGTSNPAAGLAGGYSRGVGLLTLRLGL